MAVTLNPFLAKIILKLNPFRKFLIVCKGYNEDYENFTELVWQDDKDLNFNDRISYTQFQLWVMPKITEYKQSKIYA